MKHMVYHHWTTEQKTDSFDLSREKIRNQILKNWERGREREQGDISADIQWQDWKHKRDSQI